MVPSSKTNTNSGDMRSDMPHGIEYSHAYGEKARVINTTEKRRKEKLKTERKKSDMN